MTDPDHTARRERHDALFRIHHDAVWRYAVRRVGVDRAEDVVSETFLVAWRRLETMSEHEQAWLIGVARRVVANQHRSVNRQAGLVARLAGQRPLENPHPEPAAVPDVPADDVLCALATLPQRDQEALRLVYWDNLEPAQAARAFGCSPVAMRVRLHRARARLARTLADQGFAPGDDPQLTPYRPTEA